MAEIGREVAIFAGGERMAVYCASVLKSRLSGTSNKADIRLSELPFCQAESSSAEIRSEQIE